MNVYILHGKVFCSRSCANNFFEYQQDEKDIKKSKIPKSIKNKIMNLLIGRAECESCGTLFVEIEQEKQAKNKNIR